MSSAAKQIYFSEGFSGNNKFTFEVLQENDGTYRAICARWNKRLNQMREQTHYTSQTKEGLKAQNYPALREVKIFLQSDFWDS
ncbi:MULTISPECIES: sugar ABC transporter substrate-binding protein [Rosenbergiella]|uniref:sugar ABC transporter substrate-binding protein n=1 Tax=Rosenbergiella TaxID=1356488 RepID=UPI001F4FBAAB|nr:MULTISPECIES: sugar ABC transporter substrate-binding protein [Rosenbergiella]